MAWHGGILAGLLSLCLAAAPPPPADLATEDARRQAVKIATELNILLGESQDEQFIIFSDWPAGDLQKLRRQLAGCLTAVRKSMGVPEDQPVLPGRLLVLAFARYDEFARAARDFDNLTIAPDRYSYYALHGDGRAHLALYRPTAPEDPTAVASLRRAWQAQLAREFARAFIDAYRGKNEWPQWLTAGLARAVQLQIVPDEEFSPRARQLAASVERDWAAILEPDAYLNEQDEIVAASIVQKLSADRKRFAEFLNLLRTGSKVEPSLRRVYRMTYLDLTDRWRVAMREN